MESNDTLTFQDSKVVIDFYLSFKVKTLYWRVGFNLSTPLSILSYIPIESCTCTLLFSHISCVVSATGYIKIYKGNKI